MKIYIKFMVSQRCKMLVYDTLIAMDLEPTNIFLGMVELPNGISMVQREELRKVLRRSGLELLDDRSAILIDRAENVIVEMVHYFDDIPEVNFSDYLSEKLGCNYAYLAREFANIKGITIQQYIINAKIERAKELLIYDRLSLTEISYKLRYSSVAHLSSQFKKITGHSPCFYKEMEAIRSKKLKSIGIMQ